MNNDRDPIPALSPVCYWLSIGVALSLIAYVAVKLVQGA
jgi:hypothetical protein